MKEDEVSSPGGGARADAVSPPLVAVDALVEQCSNNRVVADVAIRDEDAILEVVAAPVAATAAVVPEQESVATLPSIDEVGGVQGMDDVVATFASASSEDIKPSVVRNEVLPPKRVERVCAAWIGEDTVMTVSPGEFVDVWTDTTTEHGWIYADHISDTGRGGWLPTFVFETLRQQQRWMKVTDSFEAVNETQLEIRQGSILKVSANTRSALGWVYAEDASSSEDAAHDRAGAPHGGWVPVFCLAWAEE